MTLLGNVFDKKNIINWYGSGVFSTLVDIDLEKGIMKPITNPQRLLQTCFEKCNVITPSQRNECYSYCRAYVEHIQESIDFSSKICRDGNPECCHNNSSHNALAYNQCIHTKKFDASISTPIFLILLIIFVFLFLNISKTWS